MASKVPLGEVCDFIRGVAFDGDEAIDLPKEGFVPILRAGNIGDELYIRDDLVWVPEKRVSKEQYFQVGDIAICMASGSPAVLGKTAQLKENFMGSVGAFCGIIRPIKADPNYIAYWLKSPTFMAWRDSQANGVNIQNLRPNEVREIEIPLLPLTEQKRIASLLARADRLRQLRRTAHDLSASVLQSVFLEMFGDPVTNSKKWDVEVIGEFVKPTKQMNPQLLGRSDFWYVDITSIDRQSKTIVEPKLLKIEDAPSRARKHISANDILVSTVRPNLNAVAKVPKHLDNQIASTGFCVLRPDTKKLNSEYLFAIVQSKYFIDHLVKNETGANYPAVSDGIILDTPIPVPPLSKQEEFAGVVARVEGLRARMGESERQVEGLFESLLAQSFETE
jgi:type I restriction enzyme S subunit